MAKKDWMVTESELEKDDYEYKVLHAVLDKSIIVSGCAGSGKSVLALIKAQRIQKERGENYKIVVFTKALCKYMNAGRNHLGLKNQFSYYKEWKWQREPKSYGHKVYLVYSKDENGNKVPFMPKADYFIVDEIQDFSREEIQEFINATNKNFFFFGDTAQSIHDYKNTMPVNRIIGLIPNNIDFEIFNLCHNYRLPLPVAKIAQYVGVNLPPFFDNVYKSKEKATPRFIQYDSISSIIKTISRMIKSENVSDVGILVSHNVDVKKVSDLLNDNSINHQLKYEDKENWRSSIDNLDFTTEIPKVMTYHSAKGLQFGTVFLPAVKSCENDSDRKALYVAMTRTYRNLFVMYSGSLPYPLSNIPNELYKTTEKDEVEDI